MIRKNLLLCKIIHIKTSSKSLFDSYMEQFQPKLETCPICGSTGNCHIHDYYGRSIIDFQTGRKQKEDLCIMRVFCDSCKHGAHSLRYSLASNLLKRNTSLPVISTVLGHQSTETTKIYLKVDTENLKSCCLSMPEISSTFYKKGGELA